MTQCLDSLLSSHEKEGALGIGHYWIARVVDLTSQSGARMLSVGPRMFKPMRPTQGLSLARRIEEAGGYDFMVTWRLRPHVTVVESGKLREAFWNDTCLDVPHPKTGRPGIPALWIQLFQPPAPPPWPTQTSNRRGSNR